MNDDRDRCVSEGKEGHPFGGIVADPERQRELADDRDSAERELASHDAVLTTYIVNTATEMISVSHSAAGRARA